MNYLVQATDRSLGRYLEFVRALNPLVFSVWVAAHTTLISLFLGRMLVRVNVLNTNLNASSSTAPVDAIANIFLSPILETLMFQAGVIILVSKVSTSKFVIIPVATLIFAAIHISNSLQSALMNISLGFFLAMTYLYWWRKSGRHRVAIDSTLLAHILHNAFWWAMRFVPASWLL